MTERSASPPGAGGDRSAEHIGPADEGGDPACWAHVFDDGADADDEAEDRHEPEAVPGHAGEASA
jgi:hypothetical protein